jgi:hypothetical protein
MQSYKDQVAALRAQLSKARGSLARDVAAAVAGSDWQAFLRDRYDVAVLVERVAELGRQPEFVATLQSAGDRARQQGGQRGRPRKPASKAASRATKPAGAAGEVS